MTASACAASFTFAADSLNEMGLFTGGDDGYDLDRAPSRAEAAVMLVRLLGQEETALSAEYAAPFTDVPDWVRPYVNYLYQNGLTNGVTADQYAPDSPCSAQSFVTFLLRALGYDDVIRGDFTWDTAIEFAMEKSILDSFNYDPGSFLRDHMVAMSFTALSRPTADGKYDSLLDQLVDAGAVDGEKAAPAAALFAGSAKCDAAAAALSSSFSATAKTIITYIQDGASFPIESNVDIKIILDKQNAGNTKMEMVTSTSLEGVSSLVRAYYADGYYYYSAGKTGFKKVMSTKELADTVYSELNMARGGLDAVTPVTSCVSCAPTVRDDGSTSYAFRLSDVMCAQISMANQNAAVNNAIVTLTLDQDGALIAEDVMLDITTGTEGEAVRKVTATTITFTAAGTGVTVTLPDDLNTYPEFNPDDAA